MLTLVGFLATIAASVVYNLYFKETQYRKVLVIACLVNFVGALLTMFFCLDFTFGLPKFLYVMLTATVTDIIWIMCVTLPVLVLFAKLMPERIEASLFAFLMGINNLTAYFVSVNLGNLINLLIGDSLATLRQDTWKLFAIQAACSLIPLLFIWLIPTREQISSVQRCFEYLKDFERN
jgi:MFS family permease